MGICNERCMSRHHKDMCCVGSSVMQDSGGEKRVARGWRMCVGVR